MARRGIKKAVTDLWYANYLSPNGHCGLCGNHGVVDTRGLVFSPRGVECGILTYCLCPNGQLGKYHCAPLEKQQIRK